MRWTYAALAICALFIATGAGAQVFHQTLPHYHTNQAGDGSVMIVGGARLDCGL
jgi:hypothetical protein